MDSPFKLQLKDLLAIRKDSAGRYPAKAARDGMTGIWDTCHPESQSWAQATNSIHSVLWGLCLIRTT